MSEIAVGTLCPSQAASELLRSQIHATGLAEVRIEVDEYCISIGDRSARRFVETAPNIIIVDMQEQASSLQALTILHGALPETWLFATSENGDPQIIIEAMRAGAREFLPKPITNQALQQAFRRYMAEKQRQKEAKSSGNIYCVTAAKGGSGTTSVSMNTAAALACAPDATIGLLDLNHTSSDIAAFLNLKPKYNIGDALAAASRLDSALLDSYTTSAHGMAIMPGPAGFESDRAPALTELARVLEVAAETYSHCFLDFAVTAEKNSFRLVTEVSTAILLIMTPDLPSIWRTDRFLRFLQKNDCLDKVRLILNRSRKADEIRDTEIQKAVSQPVYWKLPDDSVSCTEAVNSGKPVVATDSDLARSYRDLAHELTGAAVPEKRRSFLKLFS